MDKTLPIEFEKRMRAQLGDEYDEYVKSLSCPAPTSIRLNPHKPATNIESNEPVAWEPDGRYLAERPTFTLDPLLHAGAYYVQEASSMFAGYVAKQLLGDNRDVRILDLCAAPGGKSTHFASIIGDNGLLVSNEVIGSRLPILCENLTKWGNPNVVITNNDPADFKPIRGFFDIVAVDAPCSGEGLFRREPAAIGEWSIDNTRICAQRQQRIVADIWDSIKPGGYLIYSTCTFCPDEDENNMKWISQTFDAENIKIDIKPEWGITPIEKDGLTGYRFIQHRTKGEGFFCCVFRKNDGEDASFRKQKLKIKLQPVPKNLVAELSKLTLDNLEFSYYLRNDTITAIPQSIDDDYKLLADKLKIAKAGISIAKVFGTKLAPEHDLAMSWALNKGAFDCVELTLQDALGYLHRDNIFVPNTRQGFNLLTYKQIPIGFIKNIGSRWNNLYPQNWKIRMSVDGL